MDKKKTAKVLTFVGLAVLLVGVIVYYKKAVDALMNINFTVSNVRFPKISMASITVTFDVVLINPSKLGFTINSYNIGVFLYNRQIANLVSTGSTLTTNLANTGSNLDTKINNLSGVSVLTFSNQTINGLKTFAQTGSFDALQITNKKDRRNIVNETTNPNANKI